MTVGERQSDPAARRLRAPHRVGPQQQQASGWSGLFWDAFKQSRNAMVLLDAQRRQVEANGAYLALLGYQRRDLIGQPIYEFVIGGPVMAEAEWRSLLHRSHFSGVGDVRCQDGGAVRIEFAGHPETVTGQQLVLCVALRTTRRMRRFELHAAEQEPAGLSTRELEVVALIAEGLTGPEIAEELQLAHNTVRTHAHNAMVKAGARSRAHLVAKVLGVGLLWEREVSEPSDGEPQPPVTART